MEVILLRMNEKQVNDDLFDIILHVMINHRGRFVNFFNQFSIVVLFFNNRYFELIERHGNLKPLVDIKIRAPHLVQVHLVYNQITHEKEIDVRQTVQQFKKNLGEIFHLPFQRLRIFHLDTVAYNMGIGGAEELKYPQRVLHT